MSFKEQCCCGNSEEIAIIPKHELLHSTKSRTCCMRKMFQWFRVRFLCCAALHDINDAAGNKTEKTKIKINLQIQHANRIRIKASSTWTLCLFVHLCTFVSAYGWDCMWAIRFKCLFWSQRPMNIHVLGWFSQRKQWVMLFVSWIAIEGGFSPHSTWNHHLKATFIETGFVWY